MPSFLPRIAAIRYLETDLDVDAGGKRVEALKRVDRFRRGLQDVDQPLVRADLEVLARVLVLERGADHAVDVFLGGQGHGTGYGGAGALGRLDDLASRAIDRVVVVGLEPDSNFLCRYGCHLILSSRLGLEAQRGRGPLHMGRRPGRMSLQFCLPRKARGGCHEPAPLTAGNSLLDDLGDDAGADGAATLADGEPQTLVHRDRLDQLDRHLDVVTRHHHLRPLREVGDPGHIGGAEVELRTVAGEERSVATTLLLLQAVDLCFELGVRGDRARFAENLATLDLLTLG